MVKWIGLLCVLLIANLSASQAVSVHVEVQEEMAIEGRPMIAKLIIDRPSDQRVDLNSVSTKGEPLQVQLYSEATQSFTETVNNKRYATEKQISCYFFEIEGKEAGQHLLDSVSVNVGGKRYESQPTYYTVNKVLTHNNLSLSAFINSPKKLYPGQQFKVSYQLKSPKPLHIFYSHLPLLDLKGCQKKGTMQSRDYFNGQQYVTECMQQYEAKEVGEFEIEPSFVEVRFFSPGVFGQRIYQKTTCRAETEKTHFKVHDFPLQNKPASFNGAIGPISMEVSLEGSNQVCVGDKLKLKIHLQGSASSGSLRLPKISMQEGFKDQFRFNDLPLSSSTGDFGKTFVFELRPMKADLIEIPPIEFSSFDPQTNSYLTLESQPLPLTVLPSSSHPQSIAPIMGPAKEEEKTALESYSKWSEETKPATIEIRGNQMVDRLDNIKSSSSRWNYKIIAFVLVILFALQILVKKGWQLRKKTSKSHFLLQGAFANKTAPERYFLLLEKALHLRLKELNASSFEKEVQQFMAQLQEQIFSKQGSFVFEESQKQAVALYKKIGGRE